MPEPLVLRLPDEIAATPQQAQRRVVTVLVEIIYPLGRVDPAVVDPGRLDSLVERVLRALSSADREPLDELHDELEALLGPADEDEPEGAGFFAFGTLVELLYACECALGDERGGANAFLRASDLLGFLDDELGTDLHDPMVDWVAAALAGAERSHHQLAERIDEAAAALSQSR